MIGLIIAVIIAAFILLFVFLPAAAWGILGFILFLLVLILLVPIGADVSYIDKKLTLTARISAFSIKLFPREKKESGKPEGETAEAAVEKKETAAEKKKLNFSFEEILELLKRAVKGLGKFGKLRVKNFMLHFVSAGKDPYKTAMTYNYVNAALSGLAPVCANSFLVKGDIDVWTDISFTEEQLFFEAAFGIRIRLIQVLRAALAIAAGALPILVKNRKRIRKEAKAQAEAISEETAQQNTVNTQEFNSDTQERTDSNG